MNYTQTAQESVRNFSRSSQEYLDKILETAGESKSENSIVNLPVYKNIPRLVSEYAKDQELVVYLGSVEAIRCSIVAISFSPGGIRIRYDIRIPQLGQTSLGNVLVVPYLNERVKGLLLRKTVYYGLIQARFLDTPEFSVVYAEPDHSFVKFTNLEIKVRPIHWVVMLTSLIRITKTIVHGFEITSTTGSFQYRGLPGRFLPVFRWNNDR